MNVLEQLREAVLSELLARPSGEEGCIRLSIGTAVAQKPVYVGRNGRMQEHGSAFAELRSFGPHMELAALKVEIAHPRLAELVQAKARAEAEDADRARNAAAP